MFIGTKILKKIQDDGDKEEGWPDCQISWDIITHWLSIHQRHVL